MKNVKSRTRTRLTDEHLEECTRIATTEIKAHLESLNKQAKAVINISLMTDFVKESY
jgi:hypothetical protein